jgi:hypothetical protein
VCVCVRVCVCVCVCVCITVDRSSLQGLVPCTGCAGGCYQCGETAIQPGNDTALAWDMGELYGLARPTRLPAPTTSSLSRTVVMWPQTGCFAKLHIEDAERSQGLEAGHTALPPSHKSKTLSPLLTPLQVLSKRFKCVGNGLHGQVRPLHFPSA